MVRVVKAGDDIRKGVTASWFNEQNKRRSQARPNQVVPYPENPISVPCIADTGIDLARFDAANIVGPAIPYEDFDGSATQYTTASVKINDTLTQDKWGIVQGPCLPEQSSHLILTGVTWANFTHTSGHTHVDVVGGALVSSTSGKGLILSPPEAPGKPGLILIRGGTSGTVLAKTPSGGIPARSGTSITTVECDEIKIESGILYATSEKLDVANPWPIVIPGNYYIVVQQEALTSKWLATFPGVLNVRYVLGTALEQTLDGTNYLNIESPELCS